jgi:hypothetical protein
MQQPGDPCRRFQPSDPCRVITITTLRAGHERNQLLLVRRLHHGHGPADAPNTLDAVLVPTNPIRQFNPTDPCRTALGAFTVRYSVSISADNTITAVTAQTQVSVDLPPTL